MSEELSSSLLTARVISDELRVIIFVGDDDGKTGSSSGLIRVLFGSDKLSDLRAISDGLLVISSTSSSHIDHYVI